MCQIWLLYKVCEYNVEFCYICASQLAEANGSQQAAVLFDELGAGLKREVRQHILRCLKWQIKLHRISVGLRTG